MNYRPNSLNGPTLPDSTPSPAGAEAENYTWTEARSKVLISSHPTSGPTLMYVAFNREDAATDDWDVIIAPGEYVVSPDGWRMNTVSVYFTGAATFGTDFTVTGWQ
jgi:hypothetical protein